MVVKNCNENVPAHTNIVVTQILRKLHHDDVIKVNAKRPVLDKTT